jgi:putative addiction module component (TIGR02574 family)
MRKTEMDVQFAPVFELTISEKLQLLEDLWDSIATSPENIPVVDWQVEDLELRKENYVQNPNSGSSWENAKLLGRNFS